MRTALRWANVVVAGLSLVSAALVLGSNLFDADYRAHSNDTLWFVALYAVLQSLVLVAFVKDSWHVPWIAVGKAVVTYLFLFSFFAIGPIWMSQGPARYVYELFKWGPGSEFILSGFLFLGRGVGNTINALALTSHWWRPWRMRQPILSRVFSAIPILIVVLCVWTFLEVVRAQWMRDVAQLVMDGLDCATVRAKLGETTTDLRQLGKQRFRVRITYGCPSTRVLVVPEGDSERFGFVDGAEICCDQGS